MMQNLEENSGIQNKIKIEKQPVVGDKSERDVRYFIVLSKKSNFLNNKKFLTKR